MKDTVNFDFGISELAVNELETAVGLLESETRKMDSEDICLLQSAWDSDSGAVFRERYITFTAEIKQTGDDVLLQAEEIKEAARRYYFAEQEAKRLAAENGE